MEEDLLRWLMEMMVCAVEHKYSSRSLQKLTESVLRGYEAELNKLCLCVL